MAGQPQLDELAGAVDRLCQDAVASFRDVLCRAAPEGGSFTLNGALLGELALRVGVERVVKDAKVLQSIEAVLDQLLAVYGR